MKTLLTIGLALAAMASVLAAPSPTLADDNANEIFHRCVHKLQQITERTIHAQQALVHECLPIIEDLLAHGKNERAHAVAERCIRQINHATAKGLRSLHETCDECLRALRHLEAYELADRLEHICHERAAQIRHSQERAVHTIRSLF